MAWSTQYLGIDRTADVTLPRHPRERGASTVVDTSVPRSVDPG